MSCPFWPLPCSNTGRADKEAWLTDSRLMNSKTKGRCHNSVLLRSEGSVLPSSLSHVNSVTGLCQHSFQMLLHTAPPSPWHSEVCNNTCLENVNLFQCNWSIREQFEHNTYFAFAHAWFCLWEKHEVNVESCNQLNWGTWKYAKHRYVHTHLHTHKLKHEEATSVHCLC